MAPRAPARRHARGLTLTETLVALAIVVLIVTLAAPSFNQTIAQERVRGIHAELASDIAFARSEAVQRSAPVTLDVRSDSAMTCYAIYTQPPGSCNCLQGNDPCGAAAPLGTMLKLLQVPRSRHVAIGEADARISISDRRGIVVATAALTVASDDGPSLRTTLQPGGQLLTCSPNGSMPGVTPCGS